MYEILGTNMGKLIDWHVRNMIRIMFRPCETLIKMQVGFRLEFGLCVRLMRDDLKVNSTNVGYAGLSLDWCGLCPLS